MPKTSNIDDLIFRWQSNEASEAFAKCGHDDPVAVLNGTRGRKCLRRRSR